MSVAAVAGIAMGLIGGLKKGVLDNVVIGVTTLSAAVPSFVASIILLSVFATLGLALAANGYRIAGIHLDFRAAIAAASVMGEGR